MDLGISGKSAIVCGAETPLSQACATALVAEGVRVAMISSSPLAQTVLASVAGPGRMDAVTNLVAALDEPAGLDRVLSECPEPDILVNHARGLPPTDFRSLSFEDWMQAAQQIMLPGIMASTRVYDGMVGRGFGRIVNITSQCVKAPMHNLDTSNGARAGFTGFSAGLSRNRRTCDLTVNSLLPGLFDTPSLRLFAEKQAAESGEALSAVLSRLSGDNPLARFGDPREFGTLCAFLCSPLAGYINGQNILVDGGQFAGVM